MFFGIGSFARIRNWPKETICQYHQATTPRKITTYPIHSSIGGKFAGFSIKGEERRDSSSSIWYRRAMMRRGRCACGEIIGRAQLG